MFRLRNDWSDITVDDIDRHQVISEGLTSAPAGYGSALLQLARLILLGAAMDSKSGWGGQSFTLSLAGIWERSVRQMCKQLAPVTGWRSLPSNKRVRSWDDATGENDPNRLMIADILLQRDDERWVLDAKYKRDFGNESRNDRFQMCAYALGFQASRSTLVYPYGDDNLASERVILNAEYGNKSCRLEALALPMNLGPKDCSRYLEAFLNRKPS